MVVPGVSPRQTLFRVREIFSKSPEICVSETVTEKSHFTTFPEVSVADRPTNYFETDDTTDDFSYQF